MEEEQDAIAQEKNECHHFSKKIQIDLKNMEERKCSLQIQLQDLESVQVVLDEMDRKIYDLGQQPINRINALDDRIAILECKIDSVNSQLNSTFYEIEQSMFNNDQGIQIPRAQMKNQKRNNRLNTLNHSMDNPVVPKQYQPRSKTNMVTEDESWNHITTELNKGQQTFGQKVGNSFKNMVIRTADDIVINESIAEDIGMELIDEHHEDNVDNYVPSEELFNNQYYSTKPKVQQVFNTFNTHRSSQVIQSNSKLESLNIGELTQQMENQSFKLDKLNSKRTSAKQIKISIKGARRPTLLDISEEVDNTNYGKYLNTTRAHHSERERQPGRLVPHKFPSSDSFQETAKKQTKKSKINKNPKTTSKQNFLPKYIDLNPLTDPSNDDLQFD